MFTALIAAIALLLTATPAWAAPLEASAPPPPTVQARVRPVDATGVKAPGYRVVKTLSGAMCSPGSDQVRGAYRCFAGNQILDPCWVEAGATPRVLCLLRPWTHQVYRLRLAAALAPAPVLGLQPIWGVTLAGGNRCLAIDAARTPFHGRFLNYACSGGVYVLGGIHTQHRVWTATTVRSTKGKLTLGPVVAVVTAWFGRPSPRYLRA